MGPTYKASAYAVEECLRVLATPLSVLSGVGAVRGRRLAKYGLSTIEDLLYHLPFRYDDRRTLHSISEAAPGSIQSFRGRLTGLAQGRGRRAARTLLGRLEDSTGTLTLVWFNPKRYLLAELKTGLHLSVHGKVSARPPAGLTLLHPEFEVVHPEGDEQPALLPVYSKPARLTQKAVRRWVREALDLSHEFLPSFLPGEIASRQRLSDLSQALRGIHDPHRDTSVVDLMSPLGDERRALVFDELFYFQLAVGLQRVNRGTRSGVESPPRTASLAQNMLELLPFELTGAQQRVLREIYADMAAGEPMQRLLQGDVGSGKTIVAWLAALRAIENGHQAVLLAPTELLAEQHYRELARHAERLGVSTALLVGSLPESKKRSTRERIRKGEVLFVVGTHALLGEEVHVPGMGLGIIDEQHRFGVAQRRTFRGLRASAPAGRTGQCEPDLLLMSATPIPRSLAMVWYGDTAVSILDERPPARAPVQTVVLDAGKRMRVYERLRAEVERGHQAYVVLPMVEESEKLQVRAATKTSDELSQGPFQDLSVGLVHGQMSADERDDIMRRFQNGAIQVLVATTVIEVGIDVPAATVMVIEHAERFGLAQLHQLRGRVGRGEAPSYCVLIQHGSRTPDARARLAVMERTSDGFEIAEADLRARGMGEILGVRQAGVQDFRIADPLSDAAVLRAAKAEAERWLGRDPLLKAPESRHLRVLIEARWGARMDLGSTG